MTVEDTWYICTRRRECGEQHGSSCDHFSPHKRMDTCEDDTCPAIEGYVECVPMRLLEPNGRREDNG